MEDIAEKHKVHRLPIGVSHEAGAQFLGVPKLESETGEGMADIVFTTTKDWEIENDIKGMCFDTTSANSGRLACRHHMYELFLRGAFEAKSRDFRVNIDFFG